MKRNTFNKLIKDSYYISKITDKTTVYYEFCFINNKRLFSQYDYISKPLGDFTKDQLKEIGRSVG